MPFNAFDRALLSDEATLDKVALASAAVAAADDSGDAELRRDALAVLRDVIVFQLKMPSELAAPLRLSAVAGVRRRVHRRKSLPGHQEGVGVQVERARVPVSQGVRRGRGGAAHGDAADGSRARGDGVRAAHRQPAHGDTSEVFGELCVGLGEALVGNEPGSALSFVTKKTKGFPSTVKSLPSKLVSHHIPKGVSTIIARSDSNGAKISKDLRARVCTIPSPSKPPKSAR